MFQMSNASYTLQTSASKTASHTGGSSFQKPDMTSKENRLQGILAEHSFILPLEEDHLAALKYVLSLKFSDDYFCNSPVYMIITGRRGMWVYAKNEIAVIFCLHPNKKDTILVFPAYTQQDNPDYSELLAILNKSGLRIEMSRFQDIPSQNQQYRKIPEHVLDWKYPSHTIDCHKVLAKEGKDFGVIRQTVNKFAKQNVTTRRIDFDAHKNIILSIANVWTQDSPEYFENYDLASKYFKGLCKLGANKHSHIDGILLYMEGKPVGFSIWDKPYNNSKIACHFASQLNTKNITNLSTLLIYKSCEELVKHNIDYLCLGGSETDGLDRYKRKFAPVHSMHLKTYKPVIATQNKNAA